MENVFTALETLESEIDAYRKRHMKCSCCMILEHCSEPYRFECSHPFSPSGMASPSKAANYRKLSALLFEVRKQLMEI